MKNKTELKKALGKTGILVAFLCGLALLLHGIEAVHYQKIYNEAVAGILVHVTENYPDLSEQELIRILNGTEFEIKSEQEDMLKKARQILKPYGIDLEREGVIGKSQDIANEYGLLWILFVLLTAFGVFFLFLRYNRKKDEEIAAITRYIEEINRKNYSLKLDDMSEDELSMLKTEIYKTTIMLKEAAEISKRDKENLKDALSDISHQMKTPLTSIGIILDNLIDDPEMESDVRQDFILDVKREIGHIQFLVQALLKMTKLDAGTVKFLREEISLREICEEAIRNVEMLCDLKNVEIQRDYFGEGNREAKDAILCDFRWQTEAVTNILKNCVEHAPEGSSVWIKTEKNPVYGSVSITDFGPGIDREDQKHLFERFYRGKNASADGVGIGLPLAKSIVEQDKGKIFVDSTPEKTVFEVKYFINM